MLRHLVAADRQALARHDAVHLQEPLQHRARAGPRLALHDRLVPQLDRRDVARRGQRVPGPRDDDVRIDGKRLVRQRLARRLARRAAGAGHAPHQREIDFALEQGAHQFFARRNRHVDGDAGRMHTEIGQQRRQDVRAGRQHAEVQRAVIALRQRIHFLAQLRQPDVHVGGRRQHALAGHGQLQLAPHAVEHRHAEDPLQLRHLLADRGGGHEQQLARGRHGAGLGDRPHDLEMPQVDLSMLHKRSLTEQLVSLIIH
jgi:hypothetical protein